MLSSSLQAEPCSACGRHLHQWSASSALQSNQYAQQTAQISGLMKPLGGARGPRYLLASGLHHPGLVVSSGQPLREHKAWVSSEGAGTEEVWQGL